jgi:COMPASS component SWD3
VESVCLETFDIGSDVYSVQIHPGRVLVYLTSLLSVQYVLSKIQTQNHLVTAGYDKTIRLYDLERGTLLKMFNGHSLSISQTVFSPMGNVVVSGSKDNTIKFWDMVSGLCIRTIASHLGEVTAVDMSRTGIIFLLLSFFIYTDDSLHVYRNASLVML